MVVLRRLWSDGDTVALIEAWRPLYNRRRGGETDIWVPASQRSRARTTRGLATEDWRAVATAVNSFRAANHLHPNRTHHQSKRRVERLKRKFGERLATPSWDGFVSGSGVVRDNTAGAAGCEESRLRLLATAAAEADGGGGATPRQARGGPVVAEAGVGAAPRQARGDPLVSEAEADADAQYASDAVPVTVAERDGATAQEAALRSGPRSSDDAPSGPVDGFTAAAAATDFVVGPPIPKRRRTGPSTSASTSAGGAAGDGGAPSVKEERVREENERRAREDEVREANARRAREDEVREANARRAREDIAAVFGEVCAAASNDVAAMAKLTDMFKDAATMYSEVARERIELQRQMVAALAATTGGAAVPQPDAART